MSRQPHVVSGRPRAGSTLPAHNLRVPAAGDTPPTDKARRP